MGRLTEIIHYLNSEHVPTKSWMRQNYRFFYPTVKDEKTREVYRQRLNSKGKKKMKDIFDS